VLKAVLFVALIAVMIYFVTRAIERGVSARPPRPRPRRPQGPIGPDDDQDFIWRLNKKRRNPEE